MIHTHTTQDTITPPPLLQLSDWVLFPLHKQIAHFIPYTAYSTATTTTCQIGFSYCYYKFCLPTQSHNAFSLSFLPITKQTPKPSIMFLTQPPVPTLQLISALASTQYDTYNSSDPLTVWKCSICRHDNFFLFSDNICCRCYKPRRSFFQPTCPSTYCIP